MIRSVARRAVVAATAMAAVVALAGCSDSSPGPTGPASPTAIASASPAASTGERAAQLHAAAAQYAVYVRDQIQLLQATTAAFVAAYTTGDDQLARELYIESRVHWERIKPIAESYADLGPAIDAREVDLGANEEWTGWHHMEKNLWPPAEGYELSDAQRAALGDRLVADTDELAQRVNADDFSVEALHVGKVAKEFLDDAIASKITGKEEAWSGTDLWGLQANIDGAFAAFDALRPVVEESDPDLAAEIHARFSELNALLAQHGSTDEGFELYDALTAAEILALSRAAEALAEPLSRLTATAAR